MISKIYNFWQILKENLWFIPVMFCFGFMAFVCGLYYVELHYFQSVEWGKYIFQGTSDDAKSVTESLLSAMITMATLAISITIVVLSLAASQLGPRLIKTFMSDRKTKDFIGIFFGTVIACFILTVILHSQTSQAITPKFTISFVFLLCLLNMFALLGFVHHVAHACIADNVIVSVATELQYALKRLTNDQNNKKRIEKIGETDQWPKDFIQASHRIFFKKSGYVQHIDYDQILDIATEHSLRIKIGFKAGHFLVKGEDGVRVYAKTKTPETLDDSIIKCFIIGEERTATQDIEYSIRHLVEIAIRALSPGINDSFTAVHVVDHLSAALSHLFEKETPSQSFYDEEGVLRMSAKQSDEEHIIFNAFDQIRYNGCQMPNVIRHMLNRLSVLAQLAQTDEARAALLEQIKAIQHDLNALNKYTPDSNDMKKKAKELVALLEG